MSKPLLRPALWLVKLVSWLVPRRLRAEWRREWEAELQHHESLLGRWRRGGWRDGRELLRHSLGSLKDAVLLQPKRLEDEMIQDLRYGARMLLKHKIFTLVAVLSLALGIGANTAIFSLVDALLLKSLPIEQPERLVLVGVAPQASAQSNPISSYSYPMFRELRDGTSVFSGMFARDLLPMGMSTDDRTERVLGELVSGNFFSVLGVGPFLGRVLTEADDQTPGAHPVAVISYNFWKRRLGEDPQVIGKTVYLNGYPFTVIGVTQPGFFGVEVGSAPDVRIPIMMNTQVRPGTPVFERRGLTWLGIMARLKPGIDIKQAEAATDAIFQISREPDVRDIKGNSPDERLFKSLHIRLVPAEHGIAGLSRRYSQPLIILMCVVGIVLLIACINVANLLLARAAARRKEIAVRLALGAGNFRLVRQLLTESLLLAALGGLLGLIFARWGTNVLLGFLPQGRLPTTLEIAPDLRMLGFTFGITLLTALLFGLAPAIQATRTNLIPALKNETAVTVGGRRRWELGKPLVIVQVAMSLLLLIGAGLFVRSLRNLRAVDNGYRVDQLLMLSMDPGQNGSKPDQARSFYSRLIEQVSTLPGVKSASFIRNMPLSGGYSRIGIKVPGYQPRPDEEMAVLFNYVAPNFFETFGMALRMGRDFNSQDTLNSPKKVIINEQAARYFFGQENPLGRRITLEDLKDLEIIGVVQDAKYRNLREDAPQTVYLSLSQSQSVGTRTLCVRAGGSPGSLIEVIRREVRSLDPRLPLFNIKTFAEQVDESVSSERLVATLCSFFGLLALLLAAIGLYGVMAYAVARRTREIGVRMALGAQAGDVLWLVMRETLLLLLIGILIGLGIALATTRMVSSLLYGLAPNDPAAISLAVLLMTAVAVFAGYLPARKAARVDPIKALRQD